MTNREFYDNFAELSTPLIADACLRLDLPLRIAPSGIRPLRAESHVAGRALPARHYGSVDIFLESMGTAKPGDILVIDNGQRRDEGCLGDLTALEAQACGLAAVVIWGCHRDTVELIPIDLPVFSYGPYPAGPRRIDPRDPEALRIARFGDFAVTAKDVVFADADGVLFVPLERAGEVLSTAHGIWRKERRQAQKIKTGLKLREQLRFDEYMAKRSADAAYTFRQHLRDIGGAIEE